MHSLASPVRLSPPANV